MLHFQQTVDKVQLQWQCNIVELLLSPIVFWCHFLDTFLESHNPFTISKVNNVN